MPRPVAWDTIVCFTPGSLMLAHMFYSHRCVITVVTTILTKKLRRPFLPPSCLLAFRKAVLHAAQGPNGITGQISTSINNCYLKSYLRQGTIYMPIGTLVIQPQVFHQAGCTRMLRLTRNPTVSFIGKILIDCNMSVTLSFFSREYIRNYKLRLFGS